MKTFLCCKSICSGGIAGVALGLSLLAFGPSLANVGGMTFLRVPAAAGLSADAAPENEAPGQEDPLRPGVGGGVNFLLSGPAPRPPGSSDLIFPLGGSFSATDPAGQSSAADPAGPGGGEGSPAETEEDEGPVQMEHPIMGEVEIQLRIRRIASMHGVDPLLVEAVVRAESEFDPRAVSPKGAMGLMQLTEQTARHMGIENPMDVENNLEGGTKYLKALLERYPGNLKLALAAYNAGPDAVKRHKGVPPYRETRRYVEKVISEYQRLVKQARLYF